MGTANNVGFCNDPTVEYRVRSSGWNNKYKCATYNYIDPNTGQNIPYIEGSNNNLMYRYEISFFEPEPVEPYKWCFRTKLDMGRGAMVWFNGNPVVIFKNSVRLSLIVAMDLLHTLLTHTLSLSLSPLSLFLSLSLSPLQPPLGPRTKNPPPISQDWSVKYLAGSNVGITTKTCQSGWCYNNVRDDVGNYVDWGCFDVGPGNNNFTALIFEDCCDGTQQFQFARGPASGGTPPYIDLDEDALGDIMRGPGGCTGEEGIFGPLEPRVFRTELPDVLENSPESYPPFELNMAQGVPNQKFRLPMALNWPGYSFSAPVLKVSEKIHTYLNKEDARNVVPRLAMQRHPFLNTTPPHTHTHTHTHATMLFQFYVPAYAVAFKPTKISLRFGGLRYGNAEHLRFSIQSPIATVPSVQHGPPCSGVTGMGGKKFRQDMNVKFLVKGNQYVGTETYLWQDSYLKNNMLGADYTWTTHGGHEVTSVTCPSEPNENVPQKMIHSEALGDFLGTVRPCILPFILH